MLVKLEDSHRSRFREDLTAHRAISQLNDADYAEKILGVSLNTFKKCVAEDSVLALKRHTFNAIVANTGLDPGRYGSGMQKPQVRTDYGGYTKADFGFMAGQYVLYRRSFLTAENIVRAVVTIEWSESKGCLTFEERLRYVSDAGVVQSFDTEGDVYMHADRMLMTFLSIKEGEVRLTMLHVPSRRTGTNLLGPIRTTGAVLTHGFPKRFYQPVVSAVAMEQLPRTRRRTALLALSKTIPPESEEFTRPAADLKIAEEHAVVLAPLLWRNRN